MKSLAPDGDRDQDHLDIAVIRVGDGLAARLGSVAYIGPESISSNRRSAEKKLCTFVLVTPTPRTKTFMRLDER
jgi:hypothetical protein